MDDIVAEYLNILNDGSELNVFSSPRPKKPKPSNIDVTVGFYWRFFCQRVNTKEIIETDADSFDEIDGNNPLYDCFKLQWYIKGPQHNKRSDNVITQGVFEKNQQTVETFNKQHPELDKILNNPLEYYKG